MARLIVESGPQQGTAVSLSRDQQVAIGSDEECDLRLQGPGIAPRHLVVKALKEEGYGVKAVDHPFQLNGRSADAARLQDGDVLELGGTRLRFAEAAVVRGLRTLGGFELREVLGVGGMGTVYRAEQVSLHREVALKVLSKELTNDPVFVARFVAEARAAARLHHPNVVQVYDVGHDGDTFYYSMELMHQGSLEQRLKAGRLDVDEALRVVADAARGLAYAESLRIVHRDIKPDNLMLDQHGAVKIADLGLAMTDEDNVSKVVGTPHFMSPEQVLAKPLDHRSDLYSLGCTFYRLLTGRTPFKRATVKEILRAHVKEVPEPIAQLAPEAPGEVVAIVERLMAKDPAARFQSAAELLEAIEAVLAPPSRRGLLIGATAFAVLLAGGGLVFGLTRPEGESTTKIIKEKDPRVAGLLEDLRQRDAELARLRTLLDTAGLSLLARADALDKVAAAHADTEAAAQARSQAATLRAEHASRERERAARAAAVEAAVQQLRDGIQRALDAADYARAVDVLSARAVPAELRAEEPVALALAELEPAVRAHAAARLDSLRAAAQAALQARDPDRYAAAIDALAAVAEPGSGWPDAVLPNRDELRQQVAASRRALAELRDQLAAKRVASAWDEYGRGLLAEAGVLAKVDALAFEDAARGAAELAAQLRADADAEPADRATRLSESLAAAAAFLARFTAAAAKGDGEMTYQGSDGDPAEVLGFAVAGESPGLMLRGPAAVKSRPQLVPLRELRGGNLLRAFAVPGEDPAAPDRAAMLGWLAIADHLAWARSYLAGIAADRPESGTGAEAYRGALEPLAAAADTLGKVDASWARALYGELEAALLLARALDAFSAHRNLSAANLIAQLQSGHPRSLVVNALQ